MAIGLGVWGAVCSVKAITEAANARHTTSYLWSYWTFVVLVTIAIPLMLHWVF